MTLSGPMEFCFAVLLRKRQKAIYIFNYFWRAARPSVRLASAVGALIGIFVIGIVHPAKALPLMIPTAAEDAAPKISEAIRIQDCTGEVKFSRILDAVLSFKPQCIWKAN